MAATPAQIRAAIVTALQNTLGTTGLQISAYRLEAPTDLCLQVIGTDAVDYDQAMRRGFDNWTFQVQAIAGSPVSQQAQVQLDLWKAATGGVKAAIETDPTLGGIVISAQVTRASADQIYTMPGSHTELLGCVFDVFVRNTGH